jgi:Rieske Fe-S protein
MDSPPVAEASTPADEQHERRRALVILVNGAIAVLSGALGALLGAFALRPAGRTGSERWLRAGSFIDLKPGIPVPRVLSVPPADGWYRERVRQTVFLVRDGEQVRALSATCTHLGCQVRWDSEGKKFRCPCHGGAYDAQGRVIEGPPPRPLAAIDVRVDAATESVLVRV